MHRNRGLGDGNALLYCTGFQDYVDGYVATHLNRDVFLDIAAETRGLYGDRVSARINEVEQIQTCLTRLPDNFHSRGRVQQSDVSPSDDSLGLIGYGSLYSRTIALCQ